MFTPMLLNSNFQHCVYSEDCLEALSGRKLTSNISLESFLELGALCCHSEINDMDGSPRLLHTSITTAQTVCKSSISIFNRFRARGDMGAP